MRILFSSFFFLLCTPFIISAQNQKPIYRSQSDSIKLAQLELKIGDPGNTSAAVSVAYTDSLLQELRRLKAEGIIGYRYSYSPDKSFTSLDDLVAGKVDPASIRALSISRKNLEHLPSVVFKCTNMEKLEIIDAALNKLPGRMRKLKKLTSIYVYNNRPDKRLKLSRNNSVTTLRIRGDAPEKLPRRYGRIKNLDTLDLSRNMMTVFPGINKNSKLKQLMLAENYLRLTDIGTARSSSLEHLALQRNKIEKVPDGIVNFPNLKKLVLNYNAIHEISPRMSDLIGLEELGLYSNKLTAIPPSVYDLPNLRFLDLYFNEIERIDDNISKLKNVQILYLASNRIYSLSDQLGTLQNLRELYVHHNRISILPSTIRNLSGLETFRMNSNHLVDVPEWISELSNLKNIDFSQNMIHQVPSHLLKLNKLQVVAMTENPWDDRDDAEELADSLSSKGIIVHLESVD